MCNAIWRLFLEIFPPNFTWNKNLETFDSRWREIQLSYTVLNVMDLSVWLIVQLADFAIWFTVTHVTISLHKWVKIFQPKEERRRSQKSRHSHGTWKLNPIIISASLYCLSERKNTSLAGYSRTSDWTIPSWKNSS